MVSDMLKCLGKDKVQLPINYNEPISMLQKQSSLNGREKIILFSARGQSSCSGHFKITR